MDLIKDIFDCNTGDESADLDFSYLSINWWAEIIGSVPSGFTPTTLISTGSLVNIVWENTLAVGIYEITVRVRESTSTGAILATYTFRVTVHSDCATSEIDSCCNSAVVIKWLSREGGIKQWSFSGVRAFDIRIGDAITFKNASLQLQYSQRKDVYTGKRITTGDISKEQLDYLDELKYSIQAWEDNSGVLTPIVVDNNSFKKYGSKDKYYDSSLQYVLSQEIIIQSQ